jgi:hypothetical protein
MDSTGKNSIKASLLRSDKHLKNLSLSGDVISDPSAAKAALIFLYFTDGLKPVPFKPRSISVSGL